MNENAALTQWKLWMINLKNAATLELWQKLQNSKGYNRTNVTNLASLSHENIDFMTDYINLYKHFGRTVAYILYF